MRRIVQLRSAMISIKLTGMKTEGFQLDVVYFDLYGPFQSFCKFIQYIIYIYEAVGGTPVYQIRLLLYHS